MKALSIYIAFLTFLVGMAGCSKPSVTNQTAPVIVTTTSTSKVIVTTTPVSTVSSTSVADAIAKASPAVVRVITENGMGSGMVIDKAGDVLTNNHVIEGSQTVNVEFSSGLKLPAIILGRDEITDLAILKVNGVNLPVVTFGDSSKLGQGDEVIAIGYPLDLAGSTTVTKGIVSAFRNYDGVDYIQMDTSINPGNSGGALINLKGEVVGINVMSIRDAGGQTIEGMNFAIAINSAQPKIPKLIAGESILKPWVTYTDSLYDFTIQYPNGWAITENKTSSSYAVSIKSSGSVTIEILRSEIGYLTIFELLDSEIKGNSSVLPVYQVQSRINLMWQSVYQACEWMLLSQSTSTSALLKSKNLYLDDNNGYIYHVRAGANESDYEAYSSTIDTIIASFHLTQ